MKVINLDQFLELQEKHRRLKIVDVLPEDYFRKEHIAGAISLPVGKMDKYARSRLNKHDHIVVYCAGILCTASRTAAEKLDSMGFRHVYDYEPGLEDYKKYDLPLEGSMYHSIGSLVGY